MSQWVIRLPAANQGRGRVIPFGIEYSRPNPCMGRDAHAGRWTAKVTVMSSVACRYFLVPDEDDIIRLSQARFERLFSNPPTDSLAEFADQRVRWAGIIVELENRKPSKILRTTYGYLRFNRDGGLDVERYLQDAAVVVAAGFPKFFFGEAPPNVIDARQAFAKRQRDHSVWWKPGARLEQQIWDAAMDKFKYRRL